MSDEGQPIHIEPHAQPEHEAQQHFLEAVKATNQFFRKAGINMDHQMVVSGGAVYLHQLRAQGIGDRVPTDLDYVLLQGAEDLDAMEKLTEVATDFYPKAELVLEPRVHHGYVFSNPIIHAETDHGFPIDIANQWITTFPIDHPVLPGITYAYPTDNPNFFGLARNCQINGSEEARVAHPGFVAFYKRMMSRNVQGKQDNQDLQRLKALGLLSADEDMLHMLDMLCYGNDQVKGKVMDLIKAV